MVESITTRIDSVTKIPREYLQTVCPPPKSVKISVTERCNHACQYCALRLRRHPPGAMSKETYKRIIRECVDAGVKEVGVFYMGEPTMCGWIGEAVSIAKGEGIPYVFMTTNGTYYQALARYEDVMKAGLDSLKFSLNYSDPEQYSQMTGCRPELFDRFLRNIKQTRMLRDELGVKTTLWASSIQYDGAQAEKMAKTIAEVEPYLDGPVYFLPLYSMASWTAEREKELGFRPTAGNQGRIGALRDPLPCWTAFTAANISVRENGKPFLSACSFDVNGAWNIGDLSLMSFKEAWNSPEFQTLRAAHLAKDVTGSLCEKCVAYA